MKCQQTYTQEQVNKLKFINAFHLKEQCCLMCPNVSFKSHSRASTSSGILEQKHVSFEDKTLGIVQKEFSQCCCKFMWSALIRSCLFIPVVNFCCLHPKDSSGWQALCFQAVCPSLFCESHVSGTLSGNFFKFGTNIQLD